MITKSQIERLSPDEKLELIQTVWESFVADPELLPVSEPEKRELRKRSRAHRFKPASSLTEAEFRRRLDKRLSRGQ